MKRAFDILYKALAVFFSVTTAAIAVAAVAMLRFDMLGTAALYALVGAMTAGSAKEMGERLDD